MPNRNNPTDSVDIGPENVRPLPPDTKTPPPEVDRYDDEGVPVYKVGALEVRNFASMAPVVRSFVVDVASKVTGSSEDAVLEIVGAILTADTLDAILNPSDVMHAEQLVGHRFTLRGVKWSRSTFGAGLPFYALLTVSKVGDDATELLSCSATNVMAQVWAMEAHGFLPVDVMLVTSKRPTPDGYFPMRLIPAAGGESF